MNRFPVDPEEMARRHDEDYIASLRMVGEGAPIFDPRAKDEDLVVEQVKVEERKLPETYQ